MLRVWKREENQGQSENQAQAKEELNLPAVWALTRGALAFPLSDAQNGSPAEARDVPWSCRSENVHLISN